jgi:hypothetical protein
MGLRPWEFAALTPSEYEIMQEGFELKIQLSWEQTREICLYAANGDKLKVIKDKTKIIKLPLVDKNESTTDRFQKRVEELKKMKGLL